MDVLHDYLVDPNLSLLDKTRIQAQVLVPVLRALRSELGREKADTIVKQALRDWSKQLFTAIGDSVDGSPRRKWATLQSAWNEVSASEVDCRALGIRSARARSNSRCAATTRRRWNSM